MNRERIKDIKKRLEKVKQIEEERESKATSENKDKSEKDSESNDEEEGDDKSEKSEKESEKDDISKKPEEKTENEKEQTEKKGSDDENSEKSEDESKSKITKITPVSNTESKSNANTKNVKFSTKDGETSEKGDSNSDSESEEETDPIKIEKNNLIKDLAKYENYGYKETHDEIMNYLEIDDPSKYRLRAKGVQVVPFMMKGKYGKPRLTNSQQQSYSQSSNDGRSDKTENLNQNKRKKKFISKENIERLRKHKAKSRNQVVEKGVFNTLSPRTMNNGNLLKQNKTKISLMPKPKQTQKVTLELLQGMNLKDFNGKRQDDFKPRDIMSDDDTPDMNSSVFNYFFPENKKNKARIKKTTTNKFVKKIVIKDPLDKIGEEDANTNYNSEHDNKTVVKKGLKSKAGNLTTRGINQSKGSATRRSIQRGPLTGRKSNKSNGKSKSKSKKNSYGLPKKKSSQKSKMMSRAAQIDKQTKMKEKLTLNKVKFTYITPLDAENA